jgi:pimeloyl-ACP methyl ester carboxylesterase
MEGVFFSELLIHKSDYIKNTNKISRVRQQPLFLQSHYRCPYFLYDAVKDIIPNYTFILFENAGHNPMFEIQEEFDKKLIDWIISH